MPDTRLGSGSVFDVYRSQLSSWLRENMDEVRALPPKVIDPYNENGKGIVVGWEVKPVYSDYRFRVLLNNAFPFTHINIAYVGENRHLQWPHVEQNGFLCLPVEGWRPIEDLACSIQERLDFAIKLLNDCHSDEYIKRESSKEFLSYWGRSTQLNALSIVDLSRLETRYLAVVESNGVFLIGENKDAADEWLRKQGRPVPLDSFQAVFASIESAPYLPFPKSAKQLFGRMLKDSDIDSVITHLSPFENTFIVLAVRTHEATSLIGALLPAITQNGFRKPSRKKGGKGRSAQRTKATWTRFGRLSLVRVDRADSEWVHGRGLDPHHRLLAESRVVILGAGSLGSQVATRLAQAGTGHITLVDPEVLTPSNVGRHALGMNSVRRNKAEQLAVALSVNFPHGTYAGIGQTWQDVIDKSPEIFKHADLTISCVAETDQDLSWDSWRRSGGASAPTVYGWLGTQGTTGHALALPIDGPGLSCYFDIDGFLRDPDTDFGGDAQVKVEPGCGTEFQPYGPLAAGQVELLVTRLALDILVKKVSLPHHKVYACSTEDLEELGGQWTEKHTRCRPNGYTGPMEYSLPVAHCGVCYLCKAE